ncbi:S8 family peptidase [Streptomyces sp. NPDC001083]|uniref:S8 family peptidase n=1 Tax=Streptomyces sp. NPDC001083 TaxID=3364545 RepID=UPI0036BF908F
MAWMRLSAAVSTVLVATIGGVSPVSAGTSADGTSRITPGDRTVTATVRLLTGDRVTVTTLPGGRHTASVRPGPGREDIAFRTLEGDDKALTVVPSDAQALVNAGTLDRRLFDVTALIAQGYDESHASALPLIVSSGPTADGARSTARATRAAAGTADRLAALGTSASPVRDLTSIGARSLSIADDDLATFWKTLNTGATSDAARAAVTPKVSLDGRVEAVLDRSTAQINAPTAWKAGYEGQGVKVAILDTGVDANHPDLVGRVADAKDFSGSTSTNDAFGHGTHVASIVGGTGAASGGTRRGVAPRADLLIGKVLGDDGYGSESSVIDGMEWAAAQHAKVVNMSLGSGTPTDGTDSMSEAVDALTASTGTLFVVAAGNEGPSPTTVSSPGAADAALTVGAVDRDDSLASFSSRGPRLGDAAVKPDVTAPGVGIVAARAAGTTMGTPVDADYTSASGTSMATPHVAGAVALLAQQHPGWGAQQLKDALISTAHEVPGTKVTEQGGGRIDLATAMGPVTATGSLTLPPVQVGATKKLQQAATVHYTNTGDHAVTLTLAASLATTTGRVLPAGVVGVGSGTVQVAAGATADVPLSLDGAKATRGKYYGHVTATSADGTVLTHTTVSLNAHGALHKLTVIARDRDGKIMEGAAPTIWGADGFVDYTSLEPAVAEVEEGTYQVSFNTIDKAADGEELREVVDPEVKVTKDTSVTLSAADTVQVQIRTPRPAEQRGVLSYQTYRKIDGNGLIQGVMYFDVAQRIYVSPTARVTDGDFEFASRWQMVAPQLRAKVPGSSLGFTPYYVDASPAFDDKGARLTAVDAGAGTAADLRAAHVRGKLAVVRWDFSDDRALARAAADAGAKALMLVMEDGFYPWTRWSPTGDRMALPTMRAGAAEGTALLKRAKSRSTTVEFTGTVHSPYLYDVMQVSKGSVPKSLVHTVSERESAVVRSTYTRTGATSWAGEQRFGWRPYQDTAWNQYTRYVPTGGERVEYVTGGDTQWRQTVRHNVVGDPDMPLLAGMSDLPRTYRPGEHVTERWFGAVVRPAIPRGAAWQSVRNGDTLSVYIPEFSDSGTGHWAFGEIPSGGVGSGIRAGSPSAAAADLPDTATAELYRNGKRIAASDNGAWGDIEVPAGDAAYRLDLATARVSDDWDFATGTRTSWTFRSGTAATTAMLPLLQVDYSVPVDARNAVGRGRTHRLGLTVRMQDGMKAPSGVTLKAETSYDGGRTWTTASTTREGGGFSATVTRPARVHGDAYVTLRVTARDAAGDTVRQTVDRAYLHPGAR